MKKVLEAVSINDVKRLTSYVDRKTKFYSKEKAYIHKNPRRFIILVEARYYKDGDYIVAKFLTEATKKYPPDHVYKSTDPNTKINKPEPSKTYEIWIAFFGVLQELRGNKITYQTVKNVLESVPIKIWCNSPSFHWQGYNYNISVMDGALFPTNIPPQKWRKYHGGFILDKHLYILFSNIEYFLYQIYRKSLPQLVVQANRKESSKENIHMRRIKEVNIPKRKKADEKEKKDKIIVWSFIKANPPTKEHAKFIRILMKEAMKRKADVMLFLSHEQDYKKNPLSWKQKISYISHEYPELNICGESSIQTVEDSASWLSKEYSISVFISGSDKIEVYRDFFNSKNGSTFFFKEIEVVSSGLKDPDSNHDSPYSVDKAILAVVNNDFKTFSNIVLPEQKDIIIQLYKDVRRGLFKILGEEKRKICKK